MPQELESFSEDRLAFSELESIFKALNQSENIERYLSHDAMEAICLMVYKRLFRTLDLHVRHV